MAKCMSDIKMLLLLIISLFSPIHSLDNGVALTPPMGWLSWEVFRCDVNEDVMKDIADRLVEDGYKDAGYEYIIVDDCWMAPERDEDGRLQADPDRFPSGMKALADYIHGKGLKFGIYEDLGSHTCKGLPGSLDHLEVDANTFAEWEADYLKFDGCNAEHDEAWALAHLDMADYLNKTGRPIVFSCELPLYFGNQTNYTFVMEACNLWRNFDDIQDGYGYIMRTMQFYRTNIDTFVSVAGPGHWNDPDMLIIGDSLNLEHARSQMMLWSIWAAPLLMGNDLRNISEEQAGILLNKHAIAINQDPLGNMGHLHKTIDDIDVWMKKISPQVGDEFSYGLGFYNNLKKNATFEVTLESLGLKNPAGYMLMDVFGDSEEKLVQITDTFEVNLGWEDSALWHLVTVEA